MSKPPTKKPPFSVLMVTHAGEQADFLAQTLQSLAAQTLKPDQVVLVAAGPLPAAQNAVIASWAEKLPITRVDLKQNQQLGLSLNEGLAQCVHDLVARMDSDDICRPDRFEKQLAYLAAHPEISVLGSAISEFTSDPDHPSGVRAVPLTHDAICDQAFLRTPFNHMSVIYSKAAVVAAGGYRDRPGYEDFDLWTRLIVDGARMANLKEPLVLARIGNGFHQRRGGWRYAWAEWQALRTANAINPGNRWRVRMWMVPRFVLRLMPARVRRAAYALVRG